MAAAGLRGAAECQWMDMRVACVCAANRHPPSTAPPGPTENNPVVLSLCLISYVDPRIILPRCLI